MCLGTSEKSFSFIVSGGNVAIIYLISVSNPREADLHKKKGGKKENPVCPPHYCSFTSSAAMSQQAQTDCIVMWLLVLLMQI